MDGLTRGKRTYWIGVGIKGPPQQDLRDHLGMFQVNDFSVTNSDAYYIIYCNVIINFLFW